MTKVARLLVAVLLFISGVVHAGAYEDYFFAINQDNDEVVKRLIDRGFDANTVDPTGQYGLLLALRLKSKKVAYLLAQHPGTDIEVRSHQDESALMLAALRGYIDICKVLIDRNADVNKTGWTPIHYAATGGHVDVLHLLLDAHAYIDAESPNGSTPLMMAAMYGSSDAVRLLLDAGADPTLKNSLGLTALDFALRANRPDAAEAIRSAVRKSKSGGVW